MRSFGLFPVACFTAYLAAGGLDASAQTVKPPVKKPAATAQKPPPKTPPSLVGTLPTASEGMTNADVLQMVAAKLGDDIILNAIEDAPKKTFDLSASGLVALKSRGVSDQIIRVMQGRPKVILEVVPEATSAVATVDGSPTGTTSATPNSVATPVAQATEPKKQGAVSRVIGRMNPLRLGKKDSESTTKPKKVKDGEAAIIHSALPPAEVTNRVKSLLNSRNIDFATNADTGRMTTDWYGNRRCGFGINYCENKASVRITQEDGLSIVTVQVTERKREGGLSQGQWNENSKSRGEQTAELAAEIESALLK